MSLTIYLNGNYARVSQNDFESLLPGALKGQGAFETIRLYDGKIFAFKEHMDRLKRGLNHYRLRMPLSQKRIRRIAGHLSRVNKLKDARLRVIVWCQDGTKNISISVTGLTLPSRKKYRQGFKAMVSSAQRNRTSRSHIKSVNYRMFRQAFRQAQLKGYDEAILLNKHKKIVEGTRTNIFFAKDQKLYTPSIRCGCLNGITRQKVIQCARRLRIPVKTVEAPLSDLIRSDEAFFTGSTLEVIPIQSVADKRIGKKRPGSVTSDIQKAYRHLVRNNLS